jgi:hypothetical protein
MIWVSASEGTSPRTRKGTAKLSTGLLALHTRLLASPHLFF